QRLYSLSAQTQRERKTYYDTLEHTQKGDLDVTRWLAWFFATLMKAIEHANGVLNQVFTKTKFWQCAATIPMNERQIKVLNRLPDGFEGKLIIGSFCSIGTGASFIMAGNRGHRHASGNAVVGLAARTDYLRLTLALFGRYCRPLPSLETWAQFFNKQRLSTSRRDQRGAQVIPEDLECRLWLRKNGEKLRV